MLYSQQSEEHQAPGEGASQSMDAPGDMPTSRLDSRLEGDAAAASVAAEDGSNSSEDEKEYDVHRVLETRKHEGTMEYLAILDTGL